MQSIVFTCKTVTPLVMNGPYGDRPELRPPGIKASLRFWWRALHGHLPLEDKKDGNDKVIEKGLRTREGEIFGNTKGRSKVLIRVIEPIEQQISERTFLLPHKNTDREKSPVPAFVSNLSFKIRVDFEERDIKGNKVISKEELKNLFILACTLGGWGKRSRRGFGSVVVTEVDGVAVTSPTTLQDILTHLEHFVPSKHRISGTHIESTHVSQSSRDEYPKLWKIEIGSNQRSLRDIGKATHDTKFIEDTSQYKQDYSKSLGDGSHRYASPVYISLLSNGLPVVSTLKKQSWVNLDLQNKLKEKVL